MARTHTHTHTPSQSLEWTLDSAHNAAIPNFIKDTKINPCFQPSYRGPSLLFRRLRVKESSLPPGENNSITTRSTYHEDVLILIQILEEMAPWVRAAPSAMKSVIKTCGVTGLKSFYSIVVQSLCHVQPFVTPCTGACQASCPSLYSRVCWNSCPLSQWCLPTVSSSVAPLPALNLSWYQGLKKYKRASIMRDTFLCRKSIFRNVSLKIKLLNKSKIFQRIS